MARGEDIWRREQASAVIMKRWLTLCAEVARRFAVGRPAAVDGFVVGVSGGDGSGWRREAEKARRRTQN